MLALLLRSRYMARLEWMANRRPQTVFYTVERLMAVPKSKITKMKRGFRRSHDALTASAYVEDKDSGELRRPHHIDLKSGMYRGRQILDPQDD